MNISDIKLVARAVFTAGVIVAILVFFGGFIVVFFGGVLFLAMCILPFISFVGAIVDQQRSFHVGRHQDKKGNDCLPEEVRRYG